jgi:molybdopterin molybdotransferase
MLEVAQAQEIVLRHAKRLPPEIAAVMSSALGQVLAEDVCADIDSPPFAKALMDGYAVRAADVASAGVELRVVEDVPAGAVPMKSVGPGEAVRLFTGAPLPDGADCVVMQEKTEATGDRVRVNDPAAKPGQYVLPRGKEMAAGDVAVPAGTVLTPAAFGILAAVGRTTVPAFPAPRVSVLATGNELVEANTKPGPGQIRNSNGPMLVAQAVRAGALPRYLGIARDDEGQLRSFIQEGLTTSHVLVLVGGVSAGKLDLVPKVLADLGVAIHFHRVRMKPGKPLLFGTKGDVLVFGLPGNPVSSFVGFELFVRPALRVLGGHADPGPRTTRLPLAQKFTANNDRPTYHPATISIGPTGAQVQGLAWFGSPDLRGVLGADALLVLPPGEVQLDAGTTAEVILL